MTDKRTLDLARQWAVNVSPHPDDPCHAAADLISSLPDEWVSADKLQEFIDEWEQLSLAEGADEVLDDLRRLLPAPTPPTLADMTPEEREACQWMQASIKGDDRRAVITEIKERVAYVLTDSGFPFGRGHDSITPLPDLPRMQWPGSEPEETHFDDLPDEVKQVMEESVEGYKAGRFVDFDTPESAAPRKNHGQPEPRHGEAWLIDIDGERTVALLGKVDPADDEPTWFTDDGGGYSCDSGNPVARLVPETTEQEDGFNFDPAYIYRDKDGDNWGYRAGRWYRLNRTGGTMPIGMKPPAEYGPYTRTEKDTSNE